MASFTAFLEVGGKKYPLYRYELYVRQEVDELGRPASPVLGGTITCTLTIPADQDSFLYQWMLSPTMQQDGKVRLLEAASKATEKTISFFNAYCTGLDISFLPGQGGGSSSRVGSSQVQLQISPQRIAIGAVVHDNNWPLESHGAGESFGEQRTPQQVSMPTLMFVSAGAIIPAISTPMVASGPSVAAIESQASTCPESVRTALQRAVDMNCKKAKSSCKGNDSCSILAVKWEAQRACAMARWKIMVKCYKGGDTRHKEEVNNRFRGMAHCEELILKKCRPKPEPTPQPAPQPVTQPSPNQQYDPDFIRKMEQLTGLTGAALLIYLIISEGSRLFPPRNLIPIP